MKQIVGLGFFYKMSKKKLLKYTTEQIIEKFKKVHGNTYNYNKVEYKGIFEKIIIICKEHGEFLQRPNDHKNGQGCSICAKQQINRIKKEGSLLENNPELCKEWDYEKNGDLKPNLFTYKSGKKVWWLCKNYKHSWKVAIRHRNNGSDCPYCSITTRKVLKGFNDLETKFPEIAKQWHPTKNNNLKSNNISAYNNKKAWWICNKKHEWQMSIHSRTYNHQNCPYCSHRKILKGFNDFQTIHPEIAEEWNYGKNGSLKPEQFFTYSMKKVWWKCKNNHEWFTSIHNRVNGTNCPECSNNRSNGENITHNILKETICSQCKEKNCKQLFGHKIFKTENKKFIIDCYCDRLKLCIEYNGKQHEENCDYYFGKNHFQKQQLRDNQLREYCKNNNIDLIEIWYTDVKVNCEKIRIDLQNKLNNLNIRFDKNKIINYNSFLKFNEEQTQKVLNKIKESNYTWQIGYEDYLYNNNMEILHLVCNNNHIHNVTYNAFIDHNHKCKICGGINRKYKSKSKKTLSVYRGIHFDNKWKKWISNINFRNKRIYLGGYNIEIDAALAYNKIAKEYNEKYNTNYVLNDIFLIS